MTTGTNYITNPSFGLGATTGWTITNGAINVDAANPQPGTSPYCGIILSTGGVLTVAQDSAGLTVGQRYTATMFYKIIPASWWDTNNCTLVGSVAGKVGTRIKTVPGDWQRARVSFTAASATQTISFVSTASVAGGSYVYVDRMMVNDGELADPYFDGGYPGCQWTGAAQASTSICPALQNYQTTSEEPIIVGGLCLNTDAWNVINRTGRLSIPTLRGANTAVPGQSGRTFVANRPYEPGIWAIGMWVLGMTADGVIPAQGDSRRLFEKNLARLQQSMAKSWQPVTIVAWQADGAARTAQAVLSGQTDGASMMGGMRGEIAFVFEVLDGWWSDAIRSTAVGAAGSWWANLGLSLPGLVGATAPIEDALVTVHGPAVNPRVTSDSGVWVQLNHTLGVNDTWIVDSGAWTSTLNGVSNLTDVTHGGHSRFLVIPPAELLATPKVTMTTSGTGANTNLSLTAARAHWTA